MAPTLPRMPNALPTLSTNIRSFAQETGAVAQNVFTNTPQALNNAWQNNENVVIEHSSNAQEHLNNIAAELKTKHVPKVSNEAKVAHEALSVDIPEAGGKLGEVEEEGVKLLQWIKDHARMCKQWGKGVGLKGKQWTESLALKCKQWFEHHAPQLVQWVKETGPKVVQWVKDNPGLVAAIVVAVVWIAICAAYPVLIPGVVVGAIRFVGFRLIGPLGGSIVATAQSILRPAAGSVFSILQSAGMDGARGLAAVARMARLVQALIGVAIVIVVAVLLFGG